ncbi:MAG: GNAT family N-acetyltransferase [Eubacterium sp.]|nr:GNAT family N-acetyltransferase [Eubacterium sp.]
MITFELAKERDVFAIDTVMRTVERALENPSFFVGDDLEFIKKHIKDEGRTILAKDQGKVVAFLILRFPKQNEDNLGRDIGITKEELLRVVHMESVGVLPEYRGKGLQEKLLAHAEELLLDEDFCYYMATVAPGNIPSQKNFEKKGYECVLMKEKYGSLLRRIYCKKVEK